LLLEIAQAAFDRLGQVIKCREVAIMSHGSLISMAVERKD
jgi:hypothetical protein